MWMKTSVVLDSGTSAMKMQPAIMKLVIIPASAGKATLAMGTTVITFARQTPRNLATNMPPACVITPAISCVSVMKDISFKSLVEIRQKSGLCNKVIITLQRIRRRWSLLCRCK